MKDGFQLWYLLGGASRYPPISITVALYATIKVGMEAAVPGEAPVGGRYSAKVEVIDARSGPFGIRCYWQIRITRSLRVFVASFLVRRNVRCLRRWPRNASRRPVAPIAEESGLPASSINAPRGLLGNRCVPFRPQFLVACISR